MKSFKLTVIMVLLGTILPASAQMSQSQIFGNIVGGALGGVAGNQIGKGNGKVAATIAGTMLGTYVGNQASRPMQNTNQTYVETSYRQQPAQSYQQPQYQNTQSAPSEWRSSDSYEPRQQVRRAPVSNQARTTYFEPYYYSVVSVSGQSLTMIGCALIDQNSQVAQPVDVTNCNSYQR